MEFMTRKNGQLCMQSLDVQIMIGDMFEACKNEHEVEWLQEQLLSIVECIGEERLEELERE